MDMNLHLGAAAAHSMDRIEACPLDATGFAPYGKVIEAPAGQMGVPINGGTSLRHDVILDMHLHAREGRPMLAIFRAQARRFPHEVTELERHRFGSQTFIPLGERRFVVVVARPGGDPQADDVAAFISNGHQGVMLAPGTWHHALLAVDAGDFAVIERAGDEVDCDVLTLQRPVRVSL